MATLTAQRTEALFLQFPLNTAHEHCSCIADHSTYKIYSILLFIAHGPVKIPLPPSNVMNMIDCSQDIFYP